MIPIESIRESRDCARRAGLFAVLLLALVTTTADAAKRNVVLFIADDQSPTMGCYGDPAARTPHMDRLAADGTRFTHAFCTTASCSASRSVVLSGLHNHANGHYGHQHSYHKFSSFPWVQTLPVMMARLGYRTARIGKHHNAPEDVYFFETKIAGGARSPIRMADNCRKFIAADDEKPFFLYFATSDPHRGGGTASELPYRPNRFGNKPNRGAYPGVEEVFYDPGKIAVPYFLPDTPTCRAELAQYYQAVSRVDQGLGRLIAVLKEEGKWDDTLFLFTSDHGMAFPGGKTTVYEGGLRVPFLVRNPYQEKRGNVNEAMISFVDITPTILDWGGGLNPSTGAAGRSVATLQRGGRQGGSRPYVFHGRSFLPILAETHPKGWDVVYASHTFHEIQMYYPMRVVRQRRYKLIWNIAHPLPYPFASDLWAAPSWQAQYKQGLDAPYGRKTVGEYIHRPEFELFDLQKDPYESHNLAADPAAAGPEDRKLLEEMKRELKEFQRSTQDPWIMKWDYE